MMDVIGASLVCGTDVTSNDICGTSPVAAGSIGDIFDGAGLGGLLSAGCGEAEAPVEGSELILCAGAEFEVTCSVPMADEVGVAGSDTEVSGEGT
tara:strand:+ start:1135 stop:1419 length:285 start_codon:yes stop_codon:yes gene_type:complete